MMAGSWIGQYTYLKGYPEIVTGKSVQFELELFSNGVEFEGLFTDDETRDLFSDAGTVENGFLENTHITFTKRYPFLWEISEMGEIEILPGFDPHVIYYSGTFIDNRFTGEWEILAFLEDEEGPYTEVHGSGTWSMVKVED